MASVSLLPRSAWGLNKELQRDAKLAVSVTATKDMPYTLLRKIMDGKVIKVLKVFQPTPQLDLSGTVWSLELWCARGPLLAMPHQLQSVMLRPRPLLLQQPRAATEGLAALINSLPDSVRHLSLGAGGESGQTRSIDVDVEFALPPRLAALELHAVRSLHCHFPSSLTSLTLGNLGPKPSMSASSEPSRWFAPPFTADLTAPLRELRLLNWDPCWPVAPLPHSLAHLHVTYKGVWGGVYTHDLVPLPCTLETLELSSPGGAEVHPVLGQLPQRLRVLHLQQVPDFNCALGPLPASLTSLSLGQRFTHALGELPESLTALRMADGPCDRPLGRLPCRLRVLDLQDRLVFDHALGALPATLRELRLSKAYDHPLQALPPALQVLALGDAFQHQLQPDLPVSLRELRLSKPYRHPLRMLPPALKVLVLGDQLQHAMPPQLPATLRELRLGRAYDHPLRALPPALEVLVLGDAFQQELQPDLPDTLREFHMGARFNAPVVLPAALQHLSIGDSYTHPLELKSTLRFARLPHSYPHALPLREIECVLINGFGATGWPGVLA
eukprot:TRINITY_DN19346_c0_g1_i1.p1 TRINITY_DN19346_c0_g1~~TRINITY_DN19346_c0_g1_i1.p1  ORF type:complete len:556 (+),score=114.25 TRINITY_DN19346_c0_g1_i1:264-1931(+)